MIEGIERIGVVGAGQMGGGIAHVAAAAGYTVVLSDISEVAAQAGKDKSGALMARSVSKGRMEQADADVALARITPAGSLQALSDCDFVVEAATENVALKKSIFEQIDAIAPPHAILASNTSSISITMLAAVTKRPETFIGMHFMNPVPVMKLVEVIRGYATSDATCAEVMALSAQLGKVPVEVNDYPGFVANRILMPMINEAILTLHEGVAGVEEIDTVMKLGMAHPMGPLQLADFIGLDVCLSILRVLHDGLGQDKYAPCPLLVNMVTAGKLGVKSGEGFYVHTRGLKDLVVAPTFAK